MSRIDIIRELLQDNEHILTFLFPQEDKVTDQNGTLDLERVRNGIGVFSGGEQIMCKVAMDIWGEYGKVELFDICRRLDGTNFKRVLIAMQKFRAV